MNLKPKKKEPWFDYKHKKFIAVYIALALVLVINQVVFSYLLKGREQAKASTAALVSNLFYNFGSSDVQAGSNNVLLAEFIYPDSGTNDTTTCGWALNTPCSMMIDADGAATIGSGVDDDGANYIWQTITRGFPVAGVVFSGTDYVCADTLDPTLIEDVYVDGGDGVGGFDCIPGNDVNPDVIIIDDSANGLIAGGYTDVSVGAPGSFWIHAELVSANNAYDYCNPAITPGCGAAQTETIWVFTNKEDDLLLQHANWTGPFAGQWQGDAFGPWNGNETFYDDDGNGKYNILAGWPEAVITDIDLDGRYSDTPSLLYDADGTASAGTGTDDDAIPNGTPFNGQLAPADKVCINTLGLDTPSPGLANVIIYVDGNADCIPGNGGVDSLIRDDTAIGNMPGIIVQYLAGNPLYTFWPNNVFFYFDADASGTWTWGNGAANTESLWAGVSGRNQWHPAIEGFWGAGDADGTATPGVGVNDDPVVRGSPLTYLKTSDKLCFSFSPIPNVPEDGYVDMTGDCLPQNDPPCLGGMPCAHPNLILDRSLDGLNPATTFDGTWASMAGNYAYMDLNANNAWDWGIGAPLTESLWWEASGGDYLNPADTYVYNVGVHGPNLALAGDALNLLNAALGPYGFPIEYADTDGSGTLTNTDTILEDDGNIETGPAGVPNGVIDRADDYTDYLTIRNAGTAVSGADITNIALYQTGANDYCDSPVGSIDDTFIGNFTALGPKLWGFNYDNVGTISRYCLAVNVNTLATPGNTIILEIPQLVDNNANGLYDVGDEGWFFYSSNDMPSDAAATLPYTFTITSAPSYGSRAQDTNPPALVTDVMIKADSTGKVTITWQDPADADLANITIDETVSGQAQTFTVNAGVQTLVLENRVVGKTYTYKLRSHDSNGNLSPAIVYDLTIPTQGEVVIAAPSEIVPTPILPGAGEVLPPNIYVGDLVKSSSSAAVYYIGQDNKKHNFPSELVFKTWYENFTGVKIISAADLNKIVAGKEVYLREGTYLVKKANESKVYAIEPGGVLRWLETETIAKSLYGSRWTDRVIDLSEVMFNQYTVGNSISSAVHPTGSLISYSGGIKIYYLENGQKREVSTGIFTQSRFQTRFVAKGIASTLLYPDGLVMTAKTGVGYFQ